MNLKSSFNLFMSALSIKLVSKVWFMMSETSQEVPSLDEGSITSGMSGTFVSFKSLAFASRASTSRNKMSGFVDSYRFDSSSSPTSF